MEEKHTWEFIYGWPRFHRERIVEISKHAFMFAEKALFVRKEILFRELYVADHRLLNSDHYFGLNKDFEFKGKTLSVKASRGFGRGPAGDRCRISASYDGNSIGDAHYLLSYMGGGVKGTGPIIREKDWMLVFRMESYASSMEIFSIEYYEKILSANWTLEREHSKYDDTPLDLSKHLSKDINFPSDKSIDFELPLSGNNGSDYMRIISYPNYQYYSLWVSTGEYSGMYLYNKHFFAPKIGQNHLTQIEFCLDGVTYISNPIFCAGYSISKSLYDEWELKKKNIV